MPEFVAEHPLADLVPAEYNPRFLSEEAFVELQASLRRFGVVKPVIANGDRTLVAGHQRCKAALAIGMTTIPALILDKRAGTVDEIQFNLSHNSMENATGEVFVPPSDVYGYVQVEWDQVDEVQTGRAREISVSGKLIAKHGPYGNCVADSSSGRVIANTDYATACARYRKPLLVYYCDPEMAMDLSTVLLADFGVYDPSKVVAEPWKQYVIQPVGRLTIRTGKHAGRQYKSATYEQLVLPRLSEDTRLLDFGAGRQAYALALQGDGYKVFPYEPFLSRILKKKAGKARAQFDMPQIVTDISRIGADVATNGLYDMVVLDSVINAANTDDYHTWITTTAAGMLKPDGVLCVGTRNLNFELGFLDSETASGTYTQRNTYLTPDGRGVGHMMGQWFAMKYHTADTLREWLGRFFDSVWIDPRSEKVATLLAVCEGRKPLDREALARALNEEFNMPYPDGYRHDRHGRLVEAVLKNHPETLDT